MEANTILDHTLDVFDRCKKNGYDFATAVACLLHDCGKTITPDSVYEPKHQHIGHDFRGGDIIDGILDGFRFDGHTMSITRKAVKFHMRFHDLTKMRTCKLIEFHEKVGKNDFEAVARVANCDHPFDEEQLKVLKALKTAFAARVVLPEGLKDTLKIKEFVKKFRVDTYNKAISETT